MAVEDFAPIPPDMLRDAEEIAVRDGLTEAESDFIKLALARFAVYVFGEYERAKRMADLALPGSGGEEIAHDIILKRFIQDRNEIMVRILEGIADQERLGVIRQAFNKLEFFSGLRMLNRSL